MYEAWIGCRAKIGPSRVNQSVKFGLEVKQLNSHGFCCRNKKISFILMIENDRYHIEIHGFFILQIYAFCW